MAEIVQRLGVERVFVDMEYIGKAERQPGMDTVQNHHTVEDVKAVRQVLTAAELLVRVNPMHRESKEEIDAVIAAGADIIMLPMWQSADEVREFLRLVDRRAKTILLLETDEARLCLDEVLCLDGIDEMYVGLNDLHLSQHKTFMFELLTDGTLAEIVNKIKARGLPFGFGGVGSVIDENKLSAGSILSEHYRLGSSMVILARAFCDRSAYIDLTEFENDFRERLNANREYEKKLSCRSCEELDRVHGETEKIIQTIVGAK